MAEAAIDVLVSTRVALKALNADRSSNPSTLPCRPFDFTPIFMHAMSNKPINLFWPQWIHLLCDAIRQLISRPLESDSQTIWRQFEQLTQERKQRPFPVRFPADCSKARARDLFYTALPQPGDTAFHTTSILRGRLYMFPTTLWLKDQTCPSARGSTRLRRISSNHQAHWRETHSLHHSQGTLPLRSSERGKSDL